MKPEPDLPQCTECGKELKNHDDAVSTPVGLFCPEHVPDPEELL